MINLSKIEEIKGFMPNHEGEALMSWAKTFSKIGPLLEIGSFCGKSSIYLGLAAKEKNQVVFTIDHHKGSEEHQLNEEYFDPEIYDESLNSVNTFPLFLKNIRIFDLEDSVIPIVSSSASVAKGWNKNLGMVFIDGSHSLESATLDYESWGSHIKNGGAADSNFDTVRMLRIAEAPIVNVRVLEWDSASPGGMGEPALPSIAPALTDAIYQATGQRIRSLPVVDNGLEVASA